MFSNWLLFNCNDSVFFYSSSKHTQNIVHAPAVQSSSEKSTITQNADLSPADPLFIKKTQIKKSPTAISIRQELGDAKYAEEM